MARVNWTDQSLSDLINIADFIAKDSVRYAKITVSRIRNASQQLKTHPLSGRKVPETDTENIRELILGNYRIIYAVVSEKQVDILTVHHSAKRLDIDTNTTL
jgi:toxin ParE1/3/4